MSLHIESYIVGQRYSKFQTFQDGCHLELEPSGLFLYVCFRGVTSEEKREFQKSFHMCYKTFEDICFVCFKFGRLEWTDCPFAPGLYKTYGEIPPVPDLTKDTTMGLGLCILLADSATGELLYIRQIGLGHDFSAHWCEWVSKYLQIPMSREIYNQKINEIYQKYSTEDLAKMGKINSYKI